MPNRATWFEQVYLMFAINCANDVDIALLYVVVLIQQCGIDDTVLTVAIVLR